MNSGSFEDYCSIFNDWSKFDINEKVKSVHYLPNVIFAKSSPFGREFNYGRLVVLIKNTLVTTVLNRKG